MPKPTVPTPYELALLVDESIRLRAEIQQRQARLKEVESLIEAAALEGPHEDLAEADREGKQFRAIGNSGRVLPVIFTSDALIGSFQDKSEKHRELEALSGSPSTLQRLFKRPSKWEIMFADGHKFRAAARELLGEAAAIPFIAACRQVDKAGIPKSATKFAWDQVQ
jgi:hypothetical protein